ncbi:ABC transporter ATP-binding protein [Virgibacillus sp. MSJ-26]|uniref:ABC transporter ATP-binding protein n=1 Tax=Virgibacillus sp. MSJ-26 TaxID=2841522 RepID=UPI001C0FA8F0|nr:ABC transporter ATP-binding protein [Virgibacillus sp. MSJ-26]MBU5466575.1 ABC transporter ATP-binding protein [Virgibacillus sp. MSJ-26]
MLDVRKVSKAFGTHQVLKEISFKINPGEIIGLVGENGAGKSTLLKILATIDRPDSGSISLNNMDYIKDNKTIRKTLGFVPQDIAVWEDFSVEENMIFFEKLGWVKKSKKILHELCLDMKLDRWKEKVNTLSGGMKRKLNLAITLIHEPGLLLLDEPTVGIDLKSKNEIGTYLKNLAITKQTAIIYTSHDMDEIKKLCDRVLCIGDDPFYEEILKENEKTVITL